MSNTIYTCVGLPSSGKSTFAKQKVLENPNKIKRVNKDELRAMLDCSFWSKENEKYVLSVRDHVIETALEESKDVIVDDTNLAPKHLERFYEIGKRFSAKVEIVDFTHVPLEECIRRDKNRPNSVGEKVIRDMHRQFIQKTPKDRIQENKVAWVDGLPNACVFDLDGTLARMVSRGPYEEERCDEDAVNEHVADILKTYHLKGHKIIICSGRDAGRGSIPTTRWLDNNKIPHDYLFMRASRDTRKDSIVKEEIYKKEIEGKFNVFFVMDDRLQVCQTWWKLGLPLLRVGDPDSNF